MRLIEARELIFRLWQGEIYLRYHRHEFLTFVFTIKMANNLTSTAILLKVEPLPLTLFSRPVPESARP